MFVDRRDALKTLGLSAGATFLAEIVSRLDAQAAGKPITAKRFVFVVESNGVRPEQLSPSGVKRSSRQQQAINGPAELLDVSLADKELPFSLEPVKAWKDKVTIVQGLSGRVCGGGHSNNFGALGSLAAPREGRNISAETIDGALAKHLGGIFPHIGLGISKRLESNVIYNISAWGPNKGLPTMCKPDRVYSTLFGSVADGAAKQEFAAKNNLLDFLKDEVKAAEAKLAGPEREQFGAYLETFETLRDRQSRLNEIQHTLREKGPVVSDKYKSAVETDRLDAQFDLGAEGHHSRCWEWPMVVIGNMGGKLKTGRYVDYPGCGHKGHRTTANMYLTLLHLAGSTRETFGTADPNLKDLDQTGPLAELLA